VRGNNITPVNIPEEKLLGKQPKSSKERVEDQKQLNHVELQYRQYVRIFMRPTTTNWNYGQSLYRGEQ